MAQRNRLHPNVLPSCTLTRIAVANTLVADDRGSFDVVISSTSPLNYSLVVG